MEIYAQSGSVTATVIDASTREGVPGAVVEFAPADPAAQKRYFTTGYKGRVEATVPYGTYKVSCMASCKVSIWEIVCCAAVFSAFFSAIATRRLASSCCTSETACVF